MIQEDMVNDFMVALEISEATFLYRRVDWRWFQPGFISPATQVRILPLRLAGC